MRIEKRFIVSKNINEVIDETKNYFIKNGFKNYQENSNSLIFTRKNFLCLAINPLKWQSNITIDLSKKDDGTGIVAVFDVSTIQQVEVIESENAIWQNFADNYIKHIAKGDANDMTVASKQVSRDIIVDWVVRPVLGSLVGIAIYFALLEILH